MGYSRYGFSRNANPHGVHNPREALKGLQAETKYFTRHRDATSYETHLAETSENLTKLISLPRAKIGSCKQKSKQGEPHQHAFIPRISPMGDPRDIIAPKPKHPGRYIGREIYIGETRDRDLPPNAHDPQYRPQTYALARSKSRPFLANNPLIPSMFQRSLAP